MSRQKNHMMRLDEMRERTPAPEGIGAWAEKLRAAAFNAVKEQDIQELMESLMAKAKQGDLAAAKMVLGYLTGGPTKVKTEVIVVQQPAQKPEPKPVIAMQGSPAKIAAMAERAANASNLFHEDDQAMAATMEPSTPFEQAAAHIAHYGPTPLSELCKVCGIENSWEVLEHEWFERDGGKINITIAARHKVKS